MRCPACSATIPDLTTFCTQCGSLLLRPAVAWRAVSEPPPPLPVVRVVPELPPPRWAEPSRRDHATLLILGVLGMVVGVFGLHRFYAGRFWTGVLQLLTAGGFLIWALIDIIAICRERFEDADGRRVVRQDRAFITCPA